MPWFCLTLLSAFSLATADALTKRFFSHLTAYEMGLTRLAYIVPWLLGAMFFIPWVSPDRVFFLCLAAGLPLEVMALLCNMRALKSSPLSICLPLLAFTPAFIILTGWIILGETLTSGGMAGIGLIVLGSYCLNLSLVTQGFLAPLRAILREPGARYMLLAAAFYSLTATFGKLAILHSNPFTFGITYYLSFIVLVAACLPFQPHARVKNLRGMPLKGLIVGAFLAASIFAHWVAISQIQAAYMIAVKRTSILFGILYGAFLFHEERIRERLLGTSIMLIGAACIAWFG